MAPLFVIVKSGAGSAVFLQALPPSPLRGMNSIGHWNKLNRNEVEWRTDDFLPLDDILRPCSLINRYLPDLKFWYWLALWQYCQCLSKLEWVRTLDNSFYWKVILNHYVPWFKLRSTLNMYYYLALTISRQKVTHIDLKRGLHYWRKKTQDLQESKFSRVQLRCGKQTSASFSYLPN